MKIKMLDFTKSLKGYSNKWVALKPDTTQVVASGNSPKYVIASARRNGVDTPVLTRVPKDYGAYIL